MTSGRKNLKLNSSGQLLIVAALAIAVLISSTAIYVYELAHESVTSETRGVGILVLALEQTTRNAVISSLANISTGGENTVLNANLNKLLQAIASSHQYGTCDLNFSSLNDSGYEAGARLSWNSSSMGISSAYVDFTLHVTGGASVTTTNYHVNVTSSLSVGGSYSIGASGKNVNLTCIVYDEDEPTLAKNITVFYDDLGNWTPIDSSNQSIVDYGNGTYFLSSIVPLNTTQVLVDVLDSRGIAVRSTYDIS
jgi:hypothetical protein